MINLQIKMNPKITTLKSNKFKYSRFAAVGTVYFVVVSKVFYVAQAASHIWMWVIGINCFENGFVIREITTFKSTYVVSNRDNIVQSNTSKYCEYLHIHTSKWKLIIEISNFQIFYSKICVFLELPKRGNQFIHVSIKQLLSTRQIIL